MNVQPACKRCSEITQLVDRVYYEGDYWHVDCRVKYLRDREWLSEREAEAHFA